MVIFARQKNRKMGRVKNRIACLLLAVYLPMWLMASFHVHTDATCHGAASTERHSSEQCDDNCPLCQFQHQFYEDVPQESVTVDLPEREVDVKPYVFDEPAVFEPLFLSRAPPVLL